MNLERHRVAGKGARGQEISELDLAVKWIDVVSVLVELDFADCRDDIAVLQARFLGRAVRAQRRDVNAAGFPVSPAYLRNCGSRVGK